MVLVMARREAGLVRGSQRHSRESWKTTLETKGPRWKTGKVNSLNRFNLIVLRVGSRREMKLLLMKMMMMR
jgi:hypothetical protein